MNVCARACVCVPVQMRTVLYGKKAANLYTQAFVQNTQARKNPGPDHPEREKPGGPKTHGSPRCPGNGQNHQQADDRRHEPKAPE